MNRSPAYAGGFFVHRTCKECQYAAKRAKYALTHHIPTRDERFLEKVQKREPNECWPWTGYTYPNGYGAFRLGPDKIILAHRYAVFMSTGSFPPKGKVTRHLCNNKLCQNPGHLAVGTQQENIMNHGTQAKGERGGRAKITEVQVRQMLAERMAGVQLRDLCAKYKLSMKVVQDITRGRLWKHIHGTDGSPTVEQLLDASMKNNRKRLKPNDLQNVHRLLAAGMSTIDIAQLYGMSQSSIDKINRGKTWPNSRPLPR